MRLSTPILSVATLLVASAAEANACMQANAEGEIAEGGLSLGQFEDAIGQAFILIRPVAAMRWTTSKTSKPFTSMRFDHAIVRAIKRFLGKDVQVRGTPFGTHTAHHHAPIVMEVSEIDAI